MSPRAPRLRFCPSAALTPTEEGLILRTDLGTFQIGGSDAAAFADHLAPLLDGSRDEEAICAALGGYSRRSVTAFLGLLKDRGLVETESDLEPRWRGPAELFRSWPAAPRDAMARLSTARVLVVGLGTWGSTAAIELAAAGIGALQVIDEGAEMRSALAATIREQAPWCRVDQGSPAELETLAASRPWSLLVAALSPRDRASIERISRLAHRAKIGSLWAHNGETTAVLGPLVIPGETACRICATVEVLNPPLGESASPAPGSETSMTVRILGHQVAMEAVQVLTEYTPTDLGGRVLIDDLASRETSTHTLVRFPSCPICGASASPTGW